ncbi:MAG TPA: hypothetical protein VK752_24240 [Bryobacteraceae bacterium]|jgi:hypothetical protein|nr:hypothetical protein [Bryobacteraceae bacterium]
MLDKAVGQVPDLPAGVSQLLLLDKAVGQVPDLPTGTIAKFNPRAASNSPTG